MPAADTEPTSEWWPTPVPGLDRLTAFEHGLAAWAPYKERTGHLTVPCQHIEILHPDPADTGPSGGVAEVRVRPGVRT